MQLKKNEVLSSPFKMKKERERKRKREREKTPGADESWYYWLSEKRLKNVCWALQTFLLYDQVIQFGRVYLEEHIRDV